MSKEENLLLLRQILRGTTPPQSRSMISAVCSCARASGSAHEAHITSSIFRGDEDACDVADLPELPGCKAHGDPYERALAQATEAIALPLDTADEAGDPIPEQPGRRLRYAQHSPAPH
jgi:predicted RNase H-like HicB family nuclease